LDLSDCQGNPDSPQVARNQSRLGDAGIDQDRAQTGTAVGERGQFGLVGVADLCEAALDQRLDCSIGLSLLWHSLDKT
jgi:hypothetical protein